MWNGWVGCTSGWVHDLGFGLETGLVEFDFFTATDVALDKH